jgi:cyclophilin family peptidyl-prolyl cis-trans isomerase
MGIIQGGDPLSKDPAKKDLYGTGGLGILNAEFNATPVARGAVAAVLQPGKPDSAGAQFFIAVTDQLALNGQFTVFGRVVDGMEIVQQISEAPVDGQGRVAERIEIERVTLRDAPPPDAVPFASATADEMSAYHVVIETSKGDITLAFRPDKARSLAPTTGRRFIGS